MKKELTVVSKKSLLRTSHETKQPRLHRDWIILFLFFFIRTSIIIDVRPNLDLAVDLKQNRNKRKEKKCINLKERFHETCSYSEQQHCLRANCCLTQKLGKVDVGKCTLNNFCKNIQPCFKMYYGV